MGEIYRAVEAFAFVDERGVPRSVAPGDLMSTDDPGFAKRKHLFERVEVAVARQAGTETASAEPNEKRSLSPATHPAPAKTAGKSADKGTTK